MRDVRKKHDAELLYISFGCILYRLRFNVFYSPDRCDQKSPIYWHLAFVGCVFRIICKFLG